jgi:hypothetical protein
MTVKELIDELKKYPETMKVSLQAYDDGDLDFVEVEGVGKESVRPFESEDDKEEEVVAIKWE